MTAVTRAWFTGMSTSPWAHRPSGTSAMPANCGRRREPGGSGITRLPRFAPSRRRIEKIPHAGLAAEGPAERVDESRDRSVARRRPDGEPGIAAGQDERESLAADLVI